jgi:hypothetical protein
MSMKTDRFTVQMVVLFIGLSGLITIMGLIVLAYLGREVPEPLSTLGGAAIGALGTLLAHTSTEERRAESRTSASGAIPVEVTNPPGKPVPVESPKDVHKDMPEDGEWDEKQQKFYAAAGRRGNEESGVD